MVVVVKILCVLIGYVIGMVDTYITLVQPYQKS